MWHI